MTDGKCDDCGRIVQIGEWPFDCNRRGHGHLIRMAIMPNGRTPEYGPPIPINPISGPQITRDWMNPDGSMRPMKEEEWDHNHVGVEA